MPKQSLRPPLCRSKKPRKRTQPRASTQLDRQMMSIRSVVCRTTRTKICPSLVPTMAKLQLGTKRKRSAKRGRRTRTKELTQPHRKSKLLQPRSPSKVGQTRCALSERSFRKVSSSLTLTRVKTRASLITRSVAIILSTLVRY